MEIYLDAEAVQQIRLSAAESIEEGDTEALQEDILEAFPEERIEALEELMKDREFGDLVAAMLEDWSGDDVDELFELLEVRLGDHGADLKYSSAEDAGPAEEGELGSYD